MVKNGAEVYHDRDQAVIGARLSQHAKAYHYGTFDDVLIAIGDKPKRDDCGHFGYIRKEHVIPWDTDQALRFVGQEAGRYVKLYRDEAMTDPGTTGGVGHVLKVRTDAQIGRDLEPVEQLQGRFVLFEGAVDERAL